MTPDNKAIDDDGCCGADGANNIVVCCCASTSSFILCDVRDGLIGVGVQLARIFSLNDDYL